MDKSITDKSITNMFMKHNNAGVVVYLCGTDVECIVSIWKTNIDAPNFQLIFFFKKRYLSN
jgi:hypothetical protein